MISKNKFGFIISTLMIFTMSLAQASNLSWAELEKRFKEQNLNTKALGHVKCFFDKYENTVFQKKISQNPGTENRCSGNPEITVNTKNVFALLDFSAPADQRRMFLVNRETGSITKMAVAHGRYKASMINTHLSLNKNSVKYARYFSNEPESNAPSSGFFVSGIEYVGKFGRSMVLHGLEKGINDNACERSIVVHKHVLVTPKAAFGMSSGCAMISKDYINSVINILEGSVDSNNGTEENGAVVFVYGTRENAWPSNTCDGNFSI